jgi:serine protease Do
MRFMRPFFVLALGAALFSAAALAAPPRFVFDDDEFQDKVTQASAKLLAAHQLMSMENLRKELSSRLAPLSFAPQSRQKLEPPDLCDHLRESTFAIGSYYKCADCGLWHFNGSAGFVVGANGILCTCCHVLQAPEDATNETYVVAADATGRVFPVTSIIAADTESDTCFIRIEAAGLKPLPLRPGARTGERVYCLSHPGGYYFMFTQGMVARINLKRNDVYDEHGKTNGLLTRPVLFLNVTAEFAPGSSGGPVVDEAGNVVAQVASIADAGEPPDAASTNAPASPSVPVRFCTAAEEIIRLREIQPLAGPKGKATPAGPKTKADRPRSHN